MKNMNPVASRIVKHTLKSKFFWIVFAGLLIATLVVDALFLVQISGNGLKPSKLATYNYVIYGSLILFVILFEIYFANRFWMMDKVNGIFNIEYRNDISHSKIFLIRFLTNKLILLVLLISFYLINITFFAFIENLYFKFNLLNQIIVLLAILLIDIFISSVFIVIAQFKKQVLLGIISGIFILMLPFNSMINLLTNLSNESHGTARENINYLNTFNSHKLYKKNLDFKSFIDQYPLLPIYLKLLVEEEEKIFNEDRYAQLLADNGAVYYFSLYKEKYPQQKHFSFDGNKFKSNSIFNFIEEVHSLFELDSSKPINNSTTSIQEIWEDSYYSTNASKNINLKGQYNFNELMKKLKLNYKNDSSKIEIINLIDNYIKNTFVGERDLSSLSFGEHEFIYGEVKGLETWVKDTNMTPGVMLFEKGLLDLMRAYFKVEKNYGQKIENNINEFASSQIQKLYLNSFLNPFFVINNLEMHNYFNNKYQQSALVSGSSAFPIDNYIYYKFELKDEIEDKNFIEKTMVTDVKEKKFEFLIIINFILCLTISISTIVISYIIFKKRLQV